MTEKRYLMGIATAWADDEAQRNDCAAGSAMLLDATRDGYVVRLRRPEYVEVFITHTAVAAMDEQAIRGCIKRGCDELAAGIKSWLDRTIKDLDVPL